MKKSILLFSACLMAGLSEAQLANRSVLFNRLPADGVKKASQVIPVKANKGAAKSTASATDRWYNYGGDLMFREFDATTSGLDEYHITAPYLWFDTSSRDIYSGTPPLDFNNLVGLGEVFQPWSSDFNDSTIYPSGIMALRNSSGYTVDSIEVVGDYYRNQITTQAGYCAACVDTLIISWVTGTGGTTGDITTGSWTGPIGPVPTGGTLSRLDVVHDSTNNMAKVASHLSYPLTAASVIDTDVTYRGGSLAYVGANHIRVAIPAVTVPAGSYFAASVTFKSGNSNAPSMPTTHANFGDTVWTSDANNPVRWSLYRPWVGYHSVSGSTTADWPMNPYNPGNLNAGFFKTEVSPTWGGKYINMWAWHGATSADASTYQFPAVGMHVGSCTGCTVIGTVSLGVNEVTDLSKIAVVPNPANDKVNIFFTLATGATANVTLTNTIGQVVATQSTTTGKVAISTVALPAGVYIYSVKVNGESTTGRVVVAH